MDSQSSDGGRVEDDLFRAFDCREKGIRNPFEVDGREVEGARVDGRIILEGVVSEDDAAGGGILEGRLDQRGQGTVPDQEERL